MTETENTKSEEPVLPRTVQSKETVEQELTQFLMPQYYLATVQQQQQLLLQQQFLLQQQQQFQVQNQYVDASNLSAFGTGQLTNQGQTEQLNSSLTDYQQSHPFNNQSYIYMPALVDANLNQQSYEVTTTINGESYDDLIRIVWQREFNQLFCQLPDSPIAKWNFFESPTPKEDSTGMVLRDWAKVRFSCPVCGNGWTSMRGMILFNISIHTSIINGQYVRIGVIVATMFGQKCQKCMEDRFETAMWYPEEVTKVLHNLYVRVRHHFYGDIDLIPQLRVDRRSGNPRNRHRPELCQACKNGKCRMK